MGCASSKPKSKKDSSKQKLKSKQKCEESPVKSPSSSQSVTHASSTQLADEQLIPLENNLIEQIKNYEIQVIEYIAKLVQKELNNELVKHANSRTVSTQPADLASTTLAVLQKPENDDLITDVSSKAINTIVNTPLPNQTLTYKSLNSALRDWNFVCKNKANKSRICDLTTHTIRSCISAINEELHGNTKFDLVNFLNLESPKGDLTPPPTPKHMSQEEQWNQSAILLTRTKANQLARLLFLSNKAQPVIHPSSTIKDAYFVNRQLADKSQVTITQKEIDDMLNNSTYKNNPTITPIAQRKLDTVNVSSQLVPRKLQELTEATNPADAAHQNEFEDETCVSVQNLTWGSLAGHTDTDKQDLVDLEPDHQPDQPSTAQKTEQSDTSVEASTDTEIADPGVADLGVAHPHAEVVQVVQVDSKNDALADIVNEINNAKSCGPEEAVSEDTEVVSEACTFTPPPTPTLNPVSNGLVTIVKEIHQLGSSAKTVSEQALESNDSKRDPSSETPTLEKKDDGNMDPTLKQVLQDDRFYNNNSFKDENTVNGTDENDAATKIQAGFKGQSVRQSKDAGLNNEDI